MNKLSVKEIKMLRQKLKLAIRDFKYDNLANFHGAPTTICEEECCPHGEPTFLTWHRLYTVNMEELLEEPLPYWDWTEDSQLPKLWEDIVVPFKKGATSSIDASGKEGIQPGHGDCPRGDKMFVRRAINIEYKNCDLTNRTRMALGTINFTLFQKDIENPHDMVHDFSHCEMKDLRTASYDPLFWLHHANVDRLFSFWQKVNQLREKDIQHEIFDDMNKPLDPFHRPEHNKVKMTLENSRAKDTFDYERTFCYNYDTLTFDNMTPEEFLKKENEHKNHISCSGTSEQCSAMLIEHNKRTIVGIIVPKKVASDVHTFEICQDKECIPGGSVSTFGYKEKEISGARVSKESHRVLYTEITELVRSKKWKAEKLEAHMTTNLVEGMPQPLVIVRSNEKEIVTLGPQQKREDYGDLLDFFYLVKGGGGPGEE